MSNSSSFREFQAAFWMFVRSDGGKVIDVRRQTALKLLVVSPDGLRAMIDEDLLLASDLAVQISDCVGVKKRADVAKLKGAKNRTELVKVLEQLGQNDSLPLVADPAVPSAQTFLDFLLTSTRGKILYRSVAQLLDEALDEPGLRVHLYYPNGRPNFKGKTASPKEKQPEDETESEPKDLVDLLK